MADKIARDELIVAVIEALDKQMSTDAATHFSNALCVVDALLADYDIVEKEEHEIAGSTT